MKPLILAALLALLTAPATMAQDTPPEVIRPVRLMTVTANSDGVTRQFFGQVVAAQTVDLAFQVGGRIVQFPVLEGQEIAEGSLIAALDLEPFELQLDQARVQLDQAERTLARLEQLQGSSVSQVSVDDAETQVALARIAVQNAEYALEHATLVAPFDALVASRNVANFTTIGAGSPVVRLHDMSELRIEIDVPEVLFQQAGQNPNVALWAQFPVSGETHALEIREFVAEASAVGQTFRLTLAMPRPENTSILPGSSATVFARLVPDTPALIIPASAIHTGNDGAVGALRFVEGEDGLGTLDLVPIEIEPARDGGFVVLSGLSDGDEIVSTGVNALEDGLTVRRFTGFNT